MNQTINVATEMAEARLSSVHLRFAALIGAILFVDGYDLFNAAYVAPYIRKEWALTAPQIGMMLSIGLAGLAGGALIQGPLADRFGRRLLTVSAVWLLGAASLGLAFLVQDFATFCALRFVLGLALGMLSPLAFVYINEWAPRSCANRFSTWAFVIPFSLGGIFAGLAGMAIGPVAGWRGLYLVAGIAIPIAIVAQMILPESVRFLAARQRWDAVRRVLATVRPERAAAYADGRFITGEAESARIGPWTVLSSKYLAATLAIWVGGALSLLCIHGLTGWLPSIVLAEGGAVRTAFGYGALLMTMQIFGGVTGGWLADRFGRLSVICWGFVGGGVSLLALAGTIEGAHAVFAVAATGFFIFGAQAVLNNHIAQTYDTGIRSTGVGVAVASAVRLVAADHNLPNPMKSHATAVAQAASAPARKRRRVGRLMRCRWV
jgi:AAHS family benzoate transporter-like MFS transporter/AAHS family 4-hydroxybenzoate transporter-like MFS transporter